MNNQASSPDESRRHFPYLREWRLFVLALSLAAVALIIIRGFFVDVYLIPSGSMEPTLIPGDRILISKTDKDVRRGDIIVFDGTGSFAPYSSGSAWLKHPIASFETWAGLKSSDTVYVKRVIAVGGDHLECCTALGKLILNGSELDEPYLAAGEPASSITFKVDVPADHIWVMGDHRSVSLDSRSLLGAPGGGMIDEDKIIGTPIYRFFPLNRSGSLNK